MGLSFLGQTRIVSVFFSELILVRIKNSERSLSVLFSSRAVKPPITARKPADAHRAKFAHERSLWGAFFTLYSEQSLTSASGLTDANNEHLCIRKHDFAHYQLLSLFATLGSRNRYMALISVLINFLACRDRLEKEKLNKGPVCKESLVMKIRVL